MFTIIGGMYRENCLDPAFDQVIGSGGRAAMAVSELLRHIPGGVHLHTALTNDESLGVKSLFKNLGVNLHATIRTQSIEFQYNHSADKAVLYPDFRSIERLTRLGDLTPLGKLDAVLLFSLIELNGFPKFKAKKLVYDPQAGRYAALLPPDLVQADALAIACNRGEARTLAAQYGLEVHDNTPPLKLARAILKGSKASVVIVKNGPFGSLIVTEGSGQKLLPAYKTAKVFGIGSGDIFSSVFAALWTVLDFDPFHAAELASVATAYACSRPVGQLTCPTLPIELDKIKDSLQPINLDRVRQDGNPTGRKRGRVYLAGPFFSLAQVWLNNEIMRSLTELGLDVWSPMVEAGILTPRSSLKRVKEVVAKDLRALDDATMVFAVLDGLDAGTLFEIGYAVKRGIPVVGLAQQPTVGDLTMLHGADCQIFEDIATALYHAAWIAHRL